MEKILFRYNPWWEGTIGNTELIERKRVTELIMKQLDNHQIVLITGLRRVGKTSLLKMLIQKLIHIKNIEAKYILYVSLDDYMLSKNNIIEIVEEYRKIHKLKFNEHVYLFFDEITYKDDFELQLKNLYDSHNVKIFASSSSSSLLKTGKAYITGRSFVFELLPLNFDEYLLFKNIKLSKADNHLIPVYFDDFLKTGGIPEYVLRNDPSYIQNLIDDIIYKDIAAVHNVKNHRILRDYFLLLMERAGKQLSINKIASILHISPDTSRRYFDYFTDTYLIYPLERHGKTNERILSPKKIYAPDVGIRTFFTGFRDKGSLFENYVFLNIKKYNPTYIYRDTTEIDFITENNNLIEVKYHNEALSEKQQILFDKIKANKKLIIRNNEQLTEYLND